MSAFELVVNGLVVLIAGYYLGLVLLSFAIRAFDATGRWWNARRLGAHGHRFRGSGWGSRR